MNRAKRHIYLVMCEQIHKKSKREVQKLLSRKNLPVSDAINALVRALNKAEARRIDNTIEAITPQLRRKSF